MKLFFLGTQAEVAGAQKVLLDHARYFHAQGHQVTTAFFYDKQGLIPNWQAEQPFPILDLQGWQKGRYPLLNLPGLFLALFRLYRFLHNEKVQVIETFTPDSNLLGLPLAWLAGVPGRVGTHHTKIENRPGWFPRLHGWLVNSWLTSILIAVSDRVRDFSVKEEKVRPEKIQVILNGIEIPEKNEKQAEIRKQIFTELNLKESDLLVLTVGRFTEQKGHTHLLDAIPAVLKEAPQAVFAFAGDGPKRAEMEAKAAALGIEAQTRFLGIRQDVPDLLVAADLFCMPSLWEGLSIALLEAMAQGLPVVVTDVEGINNLIEDGEQGLVVPIGIPYALAAALARSLKDETLRQKLGTAARAKVESEFSLQGSCEKYGEVFEGLVGE